MHRREALVLLTSAALKPVFGAASPGVTQLQGSETHLAWVREVLKRMQTIKRGMTRKTLSTVFTTEGGLSTGLRRTFVSRDCPYFKVDVEFRAVGRPDRDESGRVTLVEGDSDAITKISVPYLELSIMD